MFPCACAFASWPSYRRVRRPPAPLDTVVKVDDVVTGWFDAGVTDDGKNKIVPSISLKLTNTAGDAPVASS